MITLERLQPVTEIYFTTEFLLDYNYFKENYKLIAIDLSKQQKLDADPKAIQQINFTGNLEKRYVYFIIEEVKETVLDFSKGTIKVLWFYFVLVKNGTEVTLNLPSNLIENPNDETNIPQKLLLTDL